MRALIALLALSTGCKQVECGEGTFRDGDNCVAFDPNDHDPPVTAISPDGIRSRDPLPAMLVLSTSEPATIYFTTDGSDPDPAVTVGHRDRTIVVGIANKVTVKYFAIDLAGNREDVHTAVYDSDTKGPGKVTNLAVGFTGTTADITWVNPTDPDYVGTVIARVTDLIDAEPQVATQPTVGTVLSPSVEILATGNITEFHDASRPPGPVRYVAWTYDDLGNYSSPAAAGNELPIGSLTIKVTVDRANGNTTVIQAPDNFTVTATATAASPNLTLNLTIQNRTTKFLQNPKLELVSATSASLSSSSGTADGRPFHTLGPKMFAAGATLTPSLTFTGISNSGTETIELLIASHTMMVSPGGSPRGSLAMRDLGSGQIVPALDGSLLGPQDRLGGRLRPAQAIGQHTVDIISTHGISRFDLATMATVNNISFEEGAVQALIPIDGEVLALLKLGTRRGAGPASLVKLDEAFHIKAKIALPTDDNSGWARPALSPDGTTLFIPQASAILLVDVATLAPIDIVPETPEVDLLDVGIGGGLRSVTFFGGPSPGFLVLGKNTGNVAIVRKAEIGFSTQLVINPGTTKGMSTAITPDGRVWIAFDSQVKVFDPTDDSFTLIPYGFQTNGVSVLDGKVWIHRTVGFDRGIQLDQIQETGPNAGSVITSMLPDSTTFSRFRDHWVGTIR